MFNVNEIALIISVWKKNKTKFNLFLEIKVNQKDTKISQIQYIVLRIMLNWIIVLEQKPNQSNVWFHYNYISKIFCGIMKKKIYHFIITYKKIEWWFNFISHFDHISVIKICPRLVSFCVNSILFVVPIG